MVKNAYGSKRYSLTDFGTNEKTHIGYSEGGTTIYKLVHPKDSRVLLYALYDKSEEFVSGVVGYNSSVKNVKYFCVLDVFTPTTHRQKGYATALYVSLVKKYGIKLISDKNQTPDGRKLWDRISKILQVKVLDVETDDLVSREKVTDDEIYNTQKDRYLLVAEHTRTGIDKFGMPLIGDGVLEDWINYTHVDNNGLYE